MQGVKHNVKLLLDRVLRSDAPSATHAPDGAALPGDRLPQRGIEFEGQCTCLNESHFPLFTAKPL